MNFVENKYLTNFDIIFFRESKYNYENLYLRIKLINKMLKFV